MISHSHAYTVLLLLNTSPTLTPNHFSIGVVQTTLTLNRSLPQQGTCCFVLGTQRCSKHTPNCHRCCCYSAQYPAACAIPAVAYTAACIRLRPVRKTSAALGACCSMMQISQLAPTTNSRYCAVSPAAAAFLPAPPRRRRLCALLHVLLSWPPPSPLLLF